MLSEVTRKTLPVLLALLASTLLALSHVQANPAPKRDFNDLQGYSQLSKCEIHRELVLEAPLVLMDDIWLPSCNPFNRDYLPEQCSNNGKTLVVVFPPLKISVTIDLRVIYILSVGSTLSFNTNL